MVVRSSIWEACTSSAQMVAERIKETLFRSYAEQVSQEAVSAEVIRVALWVQSVYRRASTCSDAAVMTRNLLELARAIRTPITSALQGSSATDQVKPSGEPEVDTEMGRDLLDTIAEQGDIFALRGGYWLPAPLRLVPLTQAHYLLVGGVPTHLLPDMLIHTLRLHGSFRHVESSALPELKPASEHSTSWQFQSFGSWLGPSPPTLDELAQSFFSQELLPINLQNDSSSFFEAYAAEVVKPQHLRWQPLDHVVEGRYLLRTYTPWGIRQYSVGYISNRQLTKQSVELLHTDIRRLCYALDNKAGKPTRARWDRKRGNLTLKSELPGRERKFLSSIGFLRETEGSYYPRQWVDIDPKHANRVESLLTKLGIQIDVI